VIQLWSSHPVNQDLIAGHQFACYSMKQSSEEFSCNCNHHKIQSFTKNLIDRSIDR
jgi:hypothetical protein